LKLECKIYGVEAVKIGLVKGGNLLPEKAEQAIYEAVEKYMVPLGKNLAPKRTGYLRSTIGAKKIRGGAQYRAMARYAFAVEYGAGGGPRRLPIGSRPPKPFMWNSLAEAMPKLLEHVSSVIGKQVLGKVLPKTIVRRV
jgi:hypothetical protein